MMMYTRSTTTLFFLALLVSLPGHASEIYHWVDENGVSNFSQHQPTGDAASVSTMTLEDTRPPPNDQDEVIYDVEAHEQRMAAMREERENRRESALERQRDATRQQPVVVQQPVRTYAVPIWSPGYPGRPPDRPHPPVTLPSPPSTLRPPGSGG
jgi:hypothetical protein